MTQFHIPKLKHSMLAGLLATAIGTTYALAGSNSPAHQAPAKADNHATTSHTAAPEQLATIGGLGHATKTEHKPQKSKGHNSHWSYDGKQGPENWGQLSAKYSACGEGAMQSPINFGDTFGAGGATIKFDYKVTPLNLVHNGHTVQLNYLPGSGITVDGKRYELLQLHFHTPSEHAVSNKQSVMEMHLVHKNAKGELAVVGVMMDVGGTNMALNELWAHMPTSANETNKSDKVLINARDLLPANQTYFRYMGSLTTPPCSEGVNWFVLNTPVTVSLGQAKKFADSVGFNARPLQPKKKRLVIAPIQSK